MRISPSQALIRLRRLAALKGHRMSAQSANPGNAPGKRNPRSEGTPHNFRVSDIDPGLSYAVFLQNTPILWDGVPRAMPWAGMRCPFRASCTITFSISCAHRGSDTGTPTTFPILCPRREVNKLPCRALIRLRRLAALKGPRIPAQGIALGTTSQRISVF